MLIPREHGAYGQLLFPLVTALVVGPVSAAACGFAVAAAGGFLAHEGLAVLFGRRGSRAMGEQRHAAIGSAAAFGGLGLIAGVFAFGVAPLEARYAALGTVVLAAAVMALMHRGPVRLVERGFVDQRDAARSRQLRQGLGEPQDVRLALDHVGAGDEDQR